MTINEQRFCVLLLSALTLLGGLLFLSGCKTNPHDPRNPHKISKYTVPRIRHAAPKEILYGQTNYLYIALSNGVSHLTWSNDSTRVQYIQESSNPADFSSATEIGPFVDHYDGQIDLSKNLYYRLRSTNSVSLPSGSLIWLQVASISSFGAQAFIKGTATDTSGNIVAAVAVQGVVNFGSTNIDSGQGNSCIVKYSSSGTFLWAKRLTSPAGVSGAISISTDSGGNILIIGNFTGTNVDFGGGYILNSHIDGSGHDWGDVYLAKYNSSGGIIWAKVLGGNGYDSANGLALGVDSTDNIFVDLMVNGDVTFDSIVVHAGFDDLALVKMNPNGIAVWVTLLTGPDDERGLGLVINSSGNAFLSGYFSPGARLCGETVTNLNPSTFIGKYLGIDGTCDWVNTFRGTASGLSVTPISGNLIVTGNMTQPVDFGHGNIGPGGVFLASYNDDGSNLWAKCFNNSIDGYSGSDIGTAAVSDSTGNIFFTGQLQHRVSFNGAAAISNPSFISSFNSSGVYRWAVGLNGAIHPTSMAQDASSHIDIGGDFQGLANFGGSSATCPSGSRSSFMIQYTK